MPSQTDSVVAGDGTRLLTREWPAHGDPWASVLVVHGLSEHSGRYEQLGEWLAGAGLRVHAYDHRGFGGSGGRRGHVDRWEQLLDDLQQRLAAVRDDGLPVVLFGHSMGGLICAEYAEGPRPQPDAMVLSAPGLDSGHPRYLHWLAAVLGPRAAADRDLGRARLLGTVPGFGGGRGLSHRSDGRQPPDDALRHGGLRRAVADACGNRAHPRSDAW